MKKSLLTSLVVVVFASALLSACELLGIPAQQDPQIMQKETTATEVTGDAMMKEGGKYVPYSADVLASNSDKRRVLFFFANWCPICVPADRNFSQNLDQIPDDVVLIRVNYNDTETDAEEEALAEKYDVTYQHTFIQIDENGDEVTKWNGGQINELVTNIE